MDLWQDFLDCPDDQPCFVLQWGTRKEDKEEQRELKMLREENNKLKGMLVQNKINEILIENKELRKQLKNKRELLE